MYAQFKSNAADLVKLLQAAQHFAEQTNLQKSIPDIAALLF